MTYHLDWTAFRFAHTISEARSRRVHPRVRVEWPASPQRGGHGPAMINRRAPLVACALLVLTVAASACGPAGEAVDASPVATTSVDLPASYRFVPVAITVVAGATVTWTNKDNFSHNVRLPGGAEPLAMKPGESVQHTFDTAGLFQYDCSFHPTDMKGSVLVTGS